MSVEKEPKQQPITRERARQLLKGFFGHPAITITDKEETETYYWFEVEEFGETKRFSVDKSSETIVGY